MTAWFLETNDSGLACVILKTYKIRGRWVGAVGGIRWLCFTPMTEKWLFRRGGQLDEQPRR